ncbi:OmpA family protein [Tabrizicola sp.]|uniref:OmpA family protein n=1 Tax=Tabrizicola sp. TaxID=2005166 RepID=UPI003D2CB479
MRRLLTSTAALSIALAPVNPWPLTAQTLTEAGTILAEDGTILCDPTADAPCLIEDYGPEGLLDTAGALESAAEAEAALEAEAAAALEAEAAAAAEAEAAAVLEAEAAAAAEAEAAAALEAEAAAAAEAEAAAALEAEAAAAEVEPAPLEEPAPLVLTEPAPQEPVVEPVSEPAAEPSEDPVAQTVIVAPEAPMTDPAAGLKTEAVALDPDAIPVEAPIVTEAEVETLGELLAAPELVDPTALGAAATLSLDADSTAAITSVEPLAEAPTSPEAVTSTITVLDEADTRSSSEEFAAAPVTVAPGKKDRLSDLEKVGLVALGALAIGAIIKGANDREERQVVSNTGDRVIVQNPDGSYTVYKDDDTVLRRPGSTVRTETFADGSTRTIVERADGSQVVTIRDATGRVLRRASYDATGREIVLIDDLAREVPVRVSDLPAPSPTRGRIIAGDEQAALKARLAAIEAAKIGRSFSLRQIREISQVRALAATIDAGNVTFDSGSAAIRASEAEELADLGSLMRDLLAQNPAEVFLIEGHTDATGGAAMNLALSDRRAESVALALTEYFAIPPENMVIQGYGESELLINTQADERRNRRVAVRVITPLLGAGSN